MQFTCNQCEFQTDSEFQVKIHQQSPHMGNGYPCEECKAKLKSNLTEHMFIWVRNIHPCEECGYKATRKSHPTTHTQSVHMDKKYPCEECEYQATWKKDITRHKQSVHMEK